MIIFKKLLLRLRLLFVSLITVCFTEALPGIVLCELWGAPQFSPSAVWFMKPTERRGGTKSRMTAMAIFHIVEAFLLSIQIKLFLMLHFWFITFFTSAFG